MQNQLAASNDGPVNPDFSPPVQPPQQFVWPPPQWVAWLQQQQHPPTAASLVADAYMAAPADVAAASATAASAAVGPVNCMDFISRNMYASFTLELIWT